jgi:hypothetical protein
MQVQEQVQAQVHAAPSSCYSRDHYRRPYRCFTRPLIFYYLDSFHIAPVESILHMLRTVMALRRFGASALRRFVNSTETYPAARTRLPAVHASRAVTHLHDTTLAPHPARHSLPIYFHTCAPHANMALLYKLPV